MTCGEGELMLADHRYCYPLTITVFASRYLFVCEALATTKEAYALVGGSEPLVSQYLTARG
jgi:hypothetical protein